MNINININTSSEAKKELSIMNYRRNIIKSSNYHIIACTINANCELYSRIKNKSI